MTRTDVSPAYLNGSSSASHGAPRSSSIDSRTSSPDARAVRSRSSGTQMSPVAEVVALKSPSYGVNE